MPRPLFQTRRAFVVFVLFGCGGLYAGFKTTHPFEGVTDVDRTEGTPRALHMHIVQIDLAAPGLRFQLTPPSGKLETTRQTTLDFLKVGEVADIPMKDYGVWNALSLDGGGSTTMAMEEPVTHVATVVNASSDNPSGRAVASNLAVFAVRKATP